MKEAIDCHAREERTARLRALAALCLCYWQSDTKIIRQLRQAEFSDADLDLAMEQLRKIPPLPRRRIIAGFMRLHSPAKGRPHPDLA
jgi:hypothetical protein